MKIKSSLLFIAGGLFFIIVAGYQYFDSTHKQGEALEQAKLMLSKGKGTSEEVELEEIPTLQDKDVIGILKLPTLNEILPIIKGTTEEALDKGVGHYEGTALPDGEDQIVLSGHRDTVFKRLGELEVGDELEVEMSDGTFTYVIEETFIVEADDRTVIKSTYPTELLTVTTCYPFNFVGDAPQRYIVNAKRKL
ncbi:class D sortase [Bacillus suaedaesalsae]|uniref:Class D sortase n=1 Tax=Bacillus suaedaesalsae TaxID=2810349 RepID=A0ABS2DN37_9BACI|nr:class D sortase [Bacillus suaedaesalsae]MBM6619915.1 class D sortase [Bacillus suaedaesalsae]